MKIIKTIILTFIVVLIALPWVSAKDEDDVAIVDVCYFEALDPWGVSGIIVPFVLENTGNVPIVNPKVVMYINDKFFTIEQYPEGFRTSWNEYGLDYYPRTWQPGEQLYDNYSTVFFDLRFWGEGKERGDNVRVRIVADWQNQLYESNENNNEKTVEFKVSEVAGQKDVKICELKNVSTGIPNAPIPSTPEPSNPVNTADAPVEIINVTIPVNATDTIINTTIENNATDITPPLANASCAELIEKDIKNYKYVNSEINNENYGRVCVANYQRNEKYWGSASVVVFENNNQAMKYLSDKIKNSEKSGYEKGRNVYFLKNPSDRTFIWVSGNYAITVSDYGNKMPNQLLQTYLEKYPSDLGTGRK